MNTATLEQLLSAAQAERDALREEVVLLKSQLEWFKRNLFGTGKSEKIDALQTRLGLDMPESSASEPAKQKIAYERSAAKAKRTVPAEHFEKVPVAETVEIVPEEVKADPNRYERIGAEETFEVEITPPKLWKRMIIRPKFRDLLNKSHPPLLAPAPPRPVEGGYASAGLLAFVALNKYLYHLPLYRQEKMSVQWGARLSRKTMSDWIEIVANWFEPVYGRMRQGLIEGGYVQADETPVCFADPDIKKGKTTQGYLWVISRPGGDVVFDWRLTRRHGEATTLLEGFEGLLQCDGYQAYQEFAANNENVIRLACWAHVRRKFVEALGEEFPAEVALILAQIGALYGWERKWKGRLSPKGRADARQECFRGHLRMIRAAAELLRRKARPSSRTGKACDYLFGQWSALEAQVDNGLCEIDNNLIENAIRPSAVGKKNFLFIGAPGAGQRTAIIYSIIVSCQRYGIDPLAYMSDVLRRLPAMSNQDSLDALLPSQWQPSEVEAQ